MKFSGFLILFLFTGMYSVNAQNWSLQQNNSDALLNTVWFTDHNTGWTAGENGTVLHTRNGGETWTRQPARTSDSLYSARFFDEYTGWISGEDNLVLHTTNGGQTWSDRRPSPVSGENLASLFFHDWKRGWAAGGPGGRVYYTADGSLTWQRKASLHPDAVISTIYFLDEKRGWAASGNLLYFSTDSGNNWSELVEITDNSSFKVKKVVFTNDTLGWAAGSLENDGLLLNTINGGKNWELKKTLPGEELVSVWFPDIHHGRLAGSRGSIYLTDNRGEEWEVYNSPYEYEIKAGFFLNSTEAWLVGENGTILHFTAPEAVSPDIQRPYLSRVNVSGRDEAIDLLNRALEYARSAENKTSPHARTPIYSRMSSAILDVEEYYAFRDTPQTISDQIADIRTLYWANEHRAGIELHNHAVEFPDSLTFSLKAAHHFKNAAIIQPDSTISGIYRAYNLQRAGDTGQAINAMEAALVITPGMEAGHYQYLMDLYMEAGLNDGAFETAIRAAKKFPGDQRFLQYLTDSFTEREEPEEAVRYLDSLISLEPDNTLYLYARGAHSLQIAQEKMQLALDIYEEVWVLREDLYFSDQPSEQSELEQELKNLTAEVDRLETRGRSWASDAAENLEKITELEPDHEEALAALGLLHQNMGALFYEMLVLTQDESEAGRYDRIAFTHLNSSASYYRKAAELNPSNQSYWQSLYHIYLLLDMENEAAQIRNRAGI